MWYDVEYNTSFAKLLGVNSIEDFNKEHNTNLEFDDGFVPTVSTMVELPEWEEVTPVNICYRLGLKEIPDGLKFEVSPYQE
jgi:hypothetical protein